MFLQPGQTVAGVHMSYLLLESSRAYEQNSNESNFHIFHAIMTPAAKTVLKNLVDLHLDGLTNHAVCYYILCHTIKGLKSIFYL